MLFAPSAVASPVLGAGHAHGGGSDPWSVWHFDPVVLLALGALTVAYAIAWSGLRRAGREHATVPRAIAFLLGIDILLLALVSPLHHIGMHYLLSAHMVQHMMVSDIAPILLCLGVYGPIRFALVPQPAQRWAGRPLIRRLGRPRVAFWAWVAATGAWYIPALYTRALDNPLLHQVMWLTIFITGVGVWSHILAMVPGMRMTNARRAGYAVGLLFAGMVVSEFLFLNHPLYPVYIDQPDRLFGLSPEADQIRASLLMTAEQMITLVMAATLIMWNHVDDAVADRAELDQAAREAPAAPVLPIPPALPPAAPARQS